MGLTQDHRSYDGLICVNESEKLVQSTPLLVLRTVYQLAFEAEPTEMSSAV